MAIKKSEVLTNWATNIMKVLANRKFCEIYSAVGAWKIFRWHKQCSVTIFPNL